MRDDGRLVLVARDAAALEREADAIADAGAARPLVVPLDLTTPDAADIIDAALSAAELTPDVLINNAGYGLHGAAAQLPLADQLGIVDLNVMALTTLTRHWLPGMLQRRRGGVLNVASVASFLPGPYMAVYYASKAYVLSFSEALAAEVRGSGVTVTALCPGPTESNFGRRAGFSNGAVAEAYGVMTADAVAQTGHAAFRRGKAVAVSGWRNRLAVLAVRWTPRALSLPLLAMAQRRRPS